MSNFLKYTDWKTIVEKQIEIPGFVLINYSLLDVAEDKILSWCTTDCANAAHDYNTTKSTEYVKEFLDEYHKFTKMLCQNDKHTEYNCNNCIYCDPFGFYNY